MVSLGFDLISLFLQARVGESVFLNFGGLQKPNHPSPIWMQETFHTVYLNRIGKISVLNSASSALVYNCWPIGIRPGFSMSFSNISLQFLSFTMMIAQSIFLLWKTNPSGFYPKQLVTLIFVPLPFPQFHLNYHFSYQKLIG